MFVKICASAVEVTCFSNKCLKAGPFKGCQMAYFQTQSPNLGKFCWVLQWKMLVYFMAI
jgi:hypothetical protein